MIRDRYDGPSVAINFDGTLTVDTDTDDPGEPCIPAITLTRQARDLGSHIVVSTSRPQSHYAIVRDWLNHHGVPYDHIALGHPQTDVTVDKTGLLPPIHAGTEYLTLRLTDGVDAWTDPDRLETVFRDRMHHPAERPGHTPDDPDGITVAVALSGGLDSATAFAMAEEQELPVRAIYLDHGAANREREIACAVHHAPSLDIVTVEDMKPVWEHIAPGRNATITWRIAEYLRDVLPHHTATLWLGAHADEIKLARGDKSVFFHAQLQHLLTLSGFDVHLQLPLAGLTKTDLVRWWDSRGRLRDALHHTHTCYTGVDGQHCGKCWACLQRVLAFGAAGHLLSVMATMPTDFDFTGPARKIWNQGERSGLVPSKDPDVVEVLNQLDLTEDRFKEDQ